MLFTVNNTCFWRLPNIYIRQSHRESKNQMFFHGMEQVKNSIRSDRINKYRDEFKKISVDDESILYFINNTILFNRLLLSMNDDKIFHSDQINSKIQNIVFKLKYFGTIRFKHWINRSVAKSEILNCKFQHFCTLFQKSCPFIYSVVCQIVYDYCILNSEHIILSDQVIEKINNSIYYGTSLLP